MRGLDGLDLREMHQYHHGEEEILRVKLSCCTSATNDAVGDGNCNGEAEMADRDKITGTPFQCLLEQINKIGVNAELKIHSKNFPPGSSNYYCGGYRN